MVGLLAARSEEAHGADGLVGDERGFSLKNPIPADLKVNARTFAALAPLLLRLPGSTLRKTRHVGLAQLQ